MMFDIKVNPDDIELKWSGYSDCLMSFNQQVLTNMIQMRTAKARELEPLFNNAKNWLLRDW